MPKMASFIPGLLALLFVSSAYGLTCYKCNSKESARCSWGITSFTYDTEECGSAGPLNSLIGPKCYKITAKNRQGEEYIARGCQNPPAFGCEAIAQTVGWISSLSNGDQSVDDIDCTTCDTDKCNSAQKLTGFTFVGLALAALAFFI